MYDVCVIGHITRDVIWIKDRQNEMPGGVAYYFSTALRSLGCSVCLITKLAEKDKGLLTNLVKNDIDVLYNRSEQTMSFVNTYAGDWNSRTQSVKHVAESFTPEDIPDVSARIFHLGPLTGEDIPLEILRVLSKRSRISLDAQGFLRKVQKGEIENVDWPGKHEGLTYVDILKVDSTEAEILADEEDMKKAAARLSGYGIEEIVITLGSEGALIYSKGRFYRIPALPPKSIEDPTGCGDTYMAGYIYKRLKSRSIDEAGRFAAAMASLKLQKAGPFTGSEEDVQTFLELSSAENSI